MSNSERTGMRPGAPGLPEPTIFFNASGMRESCKKQDRDVRVAAAQRRVEQAVSVRWKKRPSEPPSGTPRQLGVTVAHLVELVAQVGRVQANTTVQRSVARPLEERRRQLHSRRTEDDPQEGVGCPQGFHKSAGRQG
jgi:hypothetical protein